MRIGDGFVDRCMRLKLSDQDRIRIQMRSRVKTDELFPRYKTWNEFTLAADTLRDNDRQWWDSRKRQSPE
jgi:hypothetical protein